jgi:hypothetical protein
VRAAPLEPQLQRLARRAHQRASRSARRRRAAHHVAVQLAFESANFTRQVQGLKPCGFKLWVKCFQLVQPHHDEGLAGVAVPSVDDDGDVDVDDVAAAQRLGVAGHPVA